MDAAFLSFLVSALICGVIVFLRPYHSIDAISAFPQKVHIKAVPRVGGLAILAGVLTGALSYDKRFETFCIALILCGLPAFLGGMSEDLLKKIPARVRLLLTFASAALAFFVLDARIVSLDMPGSRMILGVAFISFAFTVFAVGGFAHALNIVDGLNGLAGIVAMLTLTTIAWVAVHVGDDSVICLSFAAIGAVAGFLLWNFPKGALFLGDGGSYFLGFVVAELAVLLVLRNTEVSPWFALTALLYPVCETLFSSYRRRRRGRNAMDADGLHLHTLVYKRLVRRNGQNSAAQNARATLYLAALSGVPLLPAAFLWDNTPALQGIAVAFCVFYVICYRGLVRFRFSPWLDARRSVHNGAFRASGRKLGKAR